MAKGRSGQTMLEKQQSIMDSFTREIRNEKYRTELNAVEQAIERGRKNKAYLENLAKQPKKPFISFYNPNSPLRNTNK
jgi:hypothetical protein